MDHRIAMAALVMGLASEKPVRSTTRLHRHQLPGLRRADARAGRGVERRVPGFSGEERSDVARALRPRQSLQPDAFDEIGRAAAAVDTRLDIAVYGGSALMLASNFRFATEDVDMSASSGHGRNGWPDRRADCGSDRLGARLVQRRRHVSSERACRPRLGSPGVWHVSTRSRTARPCRLCAAADISWRSSSKRSASTIRSRVRRNARHLEPDARCRYSTTRRMPSRCWRAIFPRAEPRREAAFPADHHAARRSRRCARIPSPKQLTASGRRAAREGVSRVHRYLHVGRRRRGPLFAHRAGACIDGDARLDALAGPRPNISPSSTGCGACRNGRAGQAAGSPSRGSRRPRRRRPCASISPLRARQSFDPATSLPMNGRSGGRAVTCLSQA